MKKKTQYSMTAKERKQKRAAELAKKNAKVPAADAGNGEAETAAKTVRTKQLWILCVSVILGLLLILTAILLPIFLLRNTSRYPVATITFSNKKSVRMEVWEETCPIASTNFIFLARNKFFDNTLVYDAQNNFIRFGAAETYTTFRYTNESFLSQVKNFNVNEVSFVSDNISLNKFGYKLKQDTDADTGRSSELGVVSYNYDNTADFVINLSENNTQWHSVNKKDETKSERFSRQAFGRIFTEDLHVLEEIYALPKNANPGVLYYQGTVPEIRISKIRVSNLNGDKWNRKFDFAKFMNEVVSGGAWRDWVRLN